jgi:hypothetical protein
MKATPAAVRIRQPVDREQGNEEVFVTLEIPELVILADGTTAEVKGVTANVVAGQLEQVVFTVEKHSGAWAEVFGPDVRLPDLTAAQPPIGK